MAGTTGVLDRVRFLGEVERKRLLSLYALADLIVMPGRALPTGVAEGFGMTYVEAAIMGRAVVAGKAGGVPEAVLDGVTGILVDGSSVDDIARAVSALCADTGLRERMGKAAKARALRMFCSRENAVALREALRDYLVTTGKNSLHTRSRATGASLTLACGLASRPA